MSCVEKRHMSHRVGSMLHHRFPNGFTDLFMDETDREVSTLTDRAFRSLCVGDDAVYNDDFLYGYSPFSCHKPLVGEPLKKAHHKESKKQGQNKNNKNDAQPWKRQQHKTLSNMSSFLKALSATEESCEGLLIKNGVMTDSNGESWDKSALRSIQKELSEFSNYHATLTEEHCRNLQHSGNGSPKKRGKETGLPSGKSSKVKNGKTTVKLRKLNIKNFFLHSEYSPFQTWKDFNQFSFGQQETSILPIDNIPKWYDLPFYKKLTEAHRKDSHKEEERQPCQQVTVEPPPPPAVAPKPIPPPPPPKILPKSSVCLAEKRCSSDGVEGNAAPWRLNRSRAKSAIQVSQPRLPSQDNNAETVDESVLLVINETRSVEVKAVDEVSSLASTPFSICQLMTPVIPSRQPTETSEILLSSALDLPLRPLSEAKVIPEPPVKRESYKSLASSILFNIKDNRKRVKSRYSPRKFKSSELPEGGSQSPQSDYLKNTQSGSEGNASGFSTPALVKDGQALLSHISEPTNTPATTLQKHETDRPLSEDYLLSNLLQTKRETAGSNGCVEENPISPFIHSKKNKSPMAKKQNYPSLKLYKKASPVENDMKHLQGPHSARAPEQTDQPTEINALSPLMLNKDLSPKALPTNTGLSPNTSNVNKDHLPMILPHATENERLPSDLPVGKRPPNVPEKSKQLMKDKTETGVQPTSKRKDQSNQKMITRDVIRAAREAINAAKSKAQSQSVDKSISETEELKENLTDMIVCSNEMLGRGRENHSNGKKEPPTVPKGNFAMSDIHPEQLPPHNHDSPIKGDLGNANASLKETESALKHVFSAKQNNYIKHQRCAVGEDERAEDCAEGYLNVDARKEMDEEITLLRDMADSEHLINDSHDLKELERARLGDTDEEVRFKNDLTSRELRNIKKGMLSMRGNTLAKKELFVRKEKEQRKQEAFTKIDSNVIVNKALLNDNYDKAKMALEEIIADRQKRRSKLTEVDASSIMEENAGHESYVMSVQQSKAALKSSVTESNEKHNDGTFALNEKDLKERLDDLRDHNHIRQILAQTEPLFGESHRWGGRIALPGMHKIDSELNALREAKAEPVTDTPSCESEETNIRVSRRVSEESGETLGNDTGGKRLDAPPVPPRNKKGGNRRDGSVTKETDSLQESVDEDVFDKKGDYEKQDIDWNPTHEPLSPTHNPNHRLHPSPQIRNEKEANNLQTGLNSQREATAERSSAKAQESCKLKRKAPLKPDHVTTPNHNNKNVAAEDQTDKINRPGEEANVDTDNVGEIPRNIISPLLLVNGVSINQSPPDQASLSSKSSYFSAESALHRNAETDSNVYHSLENLVGEVEEVIEGMRNVSRSTKRESDRTEADYYSISDHESEPEMAKRPITSHHKEEEEIYIEGQESEMNTADQSLNQDDLHQSKTKEPMSPSNIFSPNLGIPSLFKVKDNTFNNKSRKTVQPWSRRTSLSGLERGEDELNLTNHNLEPTESNTSGKTIAPAEEISSNHSVPLLSSPLNPQTENLKKLQDERFLTVPHEEDRFSEVSPSSEGLESLTTSTADTADEIGTKSGMSVEHEVTKVPSERSGSTCSGNDSQTGLPKPPAVLPKSEKAVLKALKLTNRRMKKEEVQKSSDRSPQSSSKHRADRHRGDKSESKSSSSSRNSRSSEKKHREKTKEDHHQSESRLGKTSSHSGELLLCERGDVSEENLNLDSGETSHKTCSRSQGSQNQSAQAERQGRSSDRHIRQKVDQRHYSCDRVISNMPVYKAHVCERPMSDRPFHRSQSMDRYPGDKVERKLSADASVNANLDPRTQHIDKPTMDELQQWGRGRIRASTESHLRRSTEVPHPKPVSRQSSQTSQFSRQSSFEHAIVTQAFPMTQRKLLQDPDSGQYFFVDMPVQVKTKTFFDPETGSYVQLPVQPTEGAVPQASPMEVLTPPLVVYHGFVPVPLSPLAQTATIQAPHLEPENQRCLERSRHYHEGRAYLEPIYSQHEHMLGEFLGTEELDCPS